MSSDAARKERKRLKREKKKAEQRRAASVSPYKRVGEAGEIEACYINEDWERDGTAAIHVLRRTPGGGHAVASFLVDLWCAGLKDAFGRLDISMDEFHDNLDRVQDETTLVQTDPELVRQLLAGSIRFARQNGFRLPPHYERWLNVFGGVGDVASADLSHFGKDGKLLWVGPLEDLRRRLIGCTPEEFIKRPDVDFIAEVTDVEEYDDSDDDDEYDPEFDDLVDHMRGHIDVLIDRMVTNLRQRLEKAGEAPAERLDDAVAIILIDQLLRNAPKENEDDEELADIVECAAEEIMDEVYDDAPRDEQGHPISPASLDIAIEQATRIFMEIEEDLAAREVDPSCVPGDELPEL